MDILKKEVDFLRYFIKLNESEKKDIAKHLTRSQTTAISQILLNGIKGSFKITKSKINVLRKHKSALYKIAEKHMSLQKKRILISKRIEQVSTILKEGIKWIPS